MRALIADGRYAEAEASAGEALREIDARGDGCSVEAGEWCVVLSDAMRRGGGSRRHETLELSQRAVDVLASACGAEDPRTACALHNLGSLLYVMEKHALARPPLERALAIREKTLGSEAPEVAMSLVFLAKLAYDEKGDAARAYALFERARAIQDQTLPADHPDVAWRLDRKATVDFSRGDWDEARNANERALAIRRKVLRPGHPLTAAVLNNLGILLESTGDFAGARSLLEEALQIRRAAHGPMHRNVATALKNLAGLHVRMGDTVEALPLYEQALEIQRQTGNERTIQGAMCMRDLSIVLRLANRLDEARMLSRESVAVLREYDSANDPYLASALTELGCVLRAGGEIEEARTCLEDARQAAARFTDDGGLTLAEVLFSQAELYESDRDWRGASALLDRALAIQETSLGSHHPDLAYTYQRLARTRTAAGEFDAALDSALRAEDIAREHLCSTARELEESLAWSYARTRYSGLEVALALATKNAAPEKSARVWDALIRSRSIVFDEMASRNRAAHSSADPATAQRARALAAARQRLANLSVRRGPGDSLEHYRVELSGARKERDAAERALATASLGFRREQAERRAGLAEIRSALPEQSALLAFAHYVDPSGEGSAEYLAFVLAGRTAQPIVVSLGSADAIEELVSELAHAGRSESAEAQYMQAGRALRARVWDPVAIHIGASKRLFVVPEHALQFVNFAALPLDAKTPADDARFVIEDAPAIQYLSAERDLLRARETAADHGDLLAIGGPDYDAPTADEAARGPSVALSLPASAATGLNLRSTSLSGIAFEPLPESAHEARAVKDVWSSTSEPGGDAAAPAVENGTLFLTGRSASEAAFKRLAPGRRVLHLATHGFFLDFETSSCPADDLRGSSPLKKAPTSFPDRAPARVVLPLAPTENPMLLSGLVLAGANQRAHAAPDADDGILTAEEISALDLSSVQWAVLSACDTGLGEMRRGEGLYGLRRAFQLAGVGTVITSLWPVRDDVGREWMEELYRARLIEGLDTAGAMREVSLRMLERRRGKHGNLHPLLWAGFMAVGDWR